MNTPIVSLIGQPNVGKSSLFNLLVGKKSAIVSATAGVTRDRQFSKIEIHDTPLWLVDTAGIANEHDKLSNAMYQQSEQAIEQADLILLMVDQNEPCGIDDIKLARSIQKNKKKVILILNKSDGKDPQADNYLKMGIEHHISISCLQRSGLNTLRESILEYIPHVTETLSPDHPTITIVGKPNAGKSTLSNHYAKEDRCIVSSIPGTTRDAISIELEHKNMPYTLIDTAGMRKKARIHEEIEQYATSTALRAIDKAHTVIHLIDAEENITRQDFRIVHLCLDMGKAVIIAINKIDTLSKPKRTEVRKDIEYELKHIPFVPIIEISASQGRYTQKLIELAIRIGKDLSTTYATSYLTRTLEKLVKKTPPPSRLGRPINLRMAHISKQCPLEITIRGKRTSYLPVSYERFLVKGFISNLKIVGRLIKIKFETDHNPFSD
jgi:GTP-binding protein